MRLLNLRSVTISLLSALCPIVSFAAAPLATLTYTSTTEEITLIKTNTQPPQLCVQTSGGNQAPTGCEDDSNNGHVKASVGPGGVGTFNQTMTLSGTATAAIFQTTNPNTNAAHAGYTLQIIVGPQVAGDTFSFNLKQINTCSDTLGSSHTPEPCAPADAVVLGATSVKGKLDKDKGQKITASAPVIVYMTQFVAVTDVAQVWSQVVESELEITPRKEASTPALLDDDGE
jgi:hypothetical protein